MSMVCGFPAGMFRGHVGLYLSRTDGSYHGLCALETCVLVSCASHFYDDDHDMYACPSDT
jgi:hypothetical protein